MSDNCYEVIIDVPDTWPPGGYTEGLLPGEGASSYGPPDQSSLPPVYIGPGTVWDGYDEEILTGGGVPGTPGGMDEGGACTLCQSPDVPGGGVPVPVGVSCCWLLLAGMIAIALSNLFHGRWGRVNKVNKASEDE